MLIVPGTGSLTGDFCSSQARASCSYDLLAVLMNLVIITTAGGNLHLMN
jgi:hypothetical protein